MFKKAVANIKTRPRRVKSTVIQLDSNFRPGTLRALRIESIKTNYVTAYSCDTNPDPRTVRLAADADILIHEAAGPYEGHSTPGQAGEIASRSGVGKLCLIHYSFYGDKTTQSITLEAKKTFPGEVFLAEDFMEIELSM